MHIGNILGRTYCRKAFIGEILVPLFGDRFSPASSSIQLGNVEDGSIFDTIQGLGNIILDDEQEMACYEIMLPASGSFYRHRTRMLQCLDSMLATGQPSLLVYITPHNDSSWHLTLRDRKTTVTQYFSFQFGPAANYITPAERMKRMSRKRAIGPVDVRNLFSVESLYHEFVDGCALHFPLFVEKTGDVETARRRMNEILFRRFKDEGEVVAQSGVEKEFMDFLNHYQFTTREDEPNDSTIAIHPEMLGRVFEKLLSDNRKKGTFYTSPEIVQYMCRDSLLQYLLTHTNYDRENITRLINDKNAADLTIAQLNQIDELLQTVTICDPSVGSGAFAMGMLKELYSIRESIATALEITWSPVQVKKQIIQNNIYGVDIEREAVDITRQRLWLSLVTEKQDEEGLRSLENIAIGDSLTGFDWHTHFPRVFQVKEGDVQPGFDIIIGNPPYLNFKLYSATQREAFKERYPSIFDGKADIYYYFFHLANRLGKPNSVSSLITPRYWLEAAYAKKLRGFLANATSVREIIDFRNATIFKGIGIKTAIISFFNKTVAADAFTYRYHTGKKLESFNPEEFIAASVPAQNFSAGNSWRLTGRGSAGILAQIEADSFELQEIAFCRQGIVTGLDRAFIAAAGEFDFLPKNLVRPWLKVGDIQRYAIRPIEARELVYTPSIHSIDEYPELGERLLPYKSRLSNRREAKNGRIRWFDLQWPREQWLFGEEKLICRFKAHENTFCYDNGKFFSSADTTIVVLKKDCKKDIKLKYLLALLNSKVLSFYFKSYGKLMDYRYEYYPGPVGRLRIRESAYQDDIVKLVDYVLFIKQACVEDGPISEIATFFEQIIDAAVHEVYFGAKGAGVLNHISKLPALSGGDEERNLQLVKQAYEQWTGAANPLSQALEVKSIPLGIGGKTAGG